MNKKNILLKNICKSIVFLCLALFVSFSDCFGQNTKHASKPCPFTLECSSPSVYITYERTERDKSDNDSDDEKSFSVLLRLHNNTHWRLLFEAGGGATEAETRLFYDFLNEDGEAIESIYCTACSLIWLPSGKDILFRVPSEYFKKSSAMRISFNYEWEDKPYSIKEKEPVHYVYFAISEELKNNSSN